MCAFSFLNSHSRTGMVRRAPVSTAKMIPGFPWNQKKSLNPMFMYPPRRMDVVSPTSVAAPCRLLDTAIEMIMGTGLVLIFFATASPTGATMSTVATLSTNAEIRPENRLSATMAHWTFGVIFSSPSAMRRGILLSMNSSTMAMVPVSIMSTFQLTACGAAPSGTIPRTRNSAAALSAMIHRFSEKTSSSTYMITKSARARII